MTLVVSIVDSNGSIAYTAQGTQLGIPTLDGWTLTVTNIAPTGFEPCCVCEFLSIDSIVTLALTQGS